MISELFIKKILTHAIKGALLGMVIAMAIVALISLIGALDGLGAHSSLHNLFLVQRFCIFGMCSTDYFGCGLCSW